MKTTCFKSVCLAIFFSISIAQINASEVFFLNKSVEEAIQLATKLDKPFFAFFSGTWCPTCKVMQEHTFTDDEVAKFAGDNFLAFKLNIDDKGGKEWKERFGVYLVPTIIFFDKYGNQKDVHATTLSAVNFLRIMEQNAGFTSNHNTQPIANTTQNFYNNSSTNYPPVQQSIVPTPTQSSVPVVSQPNILSTVAATSTARQLNAATSQTQILQKEKKEKTTDSEIVKEADKFENSPVSPTSRVEQQVQSVSRVQDVTNSTQTEAPSLPTQIAPTFNTVPTVPTPVDPSLVTGGKTWSIPSKKSKNETNNIDKNVKTRIENQRVVAETPLERPKRKTIILNPTVKKSEPINIYVKAERQGNVSTSYNNVVTNSVAPVPAKEYHQSTTTHSTIHSTTPTTTHRTTSIIHTPIPATRTNVYLQLGYFKEQAYADRLVRKINDRNLGHLIQQQPSKLNGVWVQKIILVGFTSKAAAEKVKMELQNAGIKSYLFD